MNQIKILFLLFTVLAFTINPVLAGTQPLVKIKILNSQTSKPVPYVNIAIDFPFRTDEPEIGRDFNIQNGLPSILLKLNQFLNRS